MLLLLLSLQVASARSEWLGDVPNSAEQSCNTCHTRGGGTPRNPFGEDYESTSAWAKLCLKDSDGDGATNGVELGDPDCAWRPGDADPEGYLSKPGDADDFPPPADTDVIDTGTTDESDKGGCDHVGGSAAPALLLLGLLRGRKRQG